MSELTQEEVNEIFKDIKRAWDEEVTESGLSVAMFVATDETGFATQYLAMYQNTKEELIKLGLTLPELLPRNIVVTITDGDKS